MQRKDKDRLKINIERGDGGISYAMYFIAIVTVLVIFVFLKFNADSYMAEQALENGLHIAETGIITSSSDKVVGGYKTAGDEKEISRLHIVSQCDYQNASISASEQSQLDYIGQEFSTLVEDQLKLENGVPKGDILKNICGKTTDTSTDPPRVSIVDKRSGSDTPGMKIYEPYYTQEPEMASDGTTLLGIKYTIGGWVEYDFTYDAENNYLAVNKILNPTSPTLKNGKAPEGATIEATVSTTFDGVRNIFAGVAGTSGTTSSSIFSKPEDQKNTKYSINVTQSSDIVPAAQDSRTAP